MQLPIHADSVDAMEALRQVEAWPCDARRRSRWPGASRRRTATSQRSYPWASVTKLATAVAVLVAAEEGIVDLDEPAGPPGSTVRHLLAHASGPAVRGRCTPSRGRARGASTRTPASTCSASIVAERAEMPFAGVLRARVGLPARGPAGARASTRSLEQLLVVARELLEPTRIARETLDEAVTRAVPGPRRRAAGLRPADAERLGPRHRAARRARRPHWTGARNSPRTFGHFGRSGTFLWVDPDAGLALACLTDLDFGDWAKEAWPRLADAVLAL